GPGLGSPLSACSGDESKFLGAADGLGPVSYAQLAVHRARVLLDRVSREVLRDDFVDLAVGRLLRGELRQLGEVDLGVDSTSGPWTRARGSRASAPSRRRYRDSSS